VLVTAACHDDTGIECSDKPIGNLFDMRCDIFAASLNQLSAAHETQRSMRARPH